MVHPLYGMQIIADVGTAMWQKTNHVIMPTREEGVPYRIKLRNSSYVRVSVEVKIDGVTVGQFMLPPLSINCLERPIDVAKRFTFFVGGSKASYEAGYVKGGSSNGLIEVTFTPEVPEPQLEEDDEDMCYSMDGDYQEGITGLFGHSNQRFGEDIYMYLDYSQSVPLSMRLVAQGM